MLKKLRDLAGAIFSRSPPVEIVHELAFPSERACAISILGNDAVQAFYKSIGADPALITERLSRLEDKPPEGDSIELLAIESIWAKHIEALSPQIPLALSRLAGFLTRGTDGIRDAVTPEGHRAGDILFLIAHGAPEAQRRSAWPAIADQTGSVLLMNDSFSTMEKVIMILETSFELRREDAIPKMLEIHKNGQAAFDAPAGVTASDFCDARNAEWREAGLPLYCVPQSREK